MVHVRVSSASIARMERRETPTCIAAAFCNRRLRVLKSPKPPAARDPASAAKRVDLVLKAFAASKEAPIVVFSCVNSGRSFEDDEGRTVVSRSCDSS